MSRYRVILTFYQDVSFCEGDPKANHFRCMVNPDGDKLNENALSGWSAKVAPMNERSKLVPIYRADKGKLMHVGGYDCYREYFCTYAQLPTGTYKERVAKMSQRPGLWEKPAQLQPRNKNFRRMVAAVQPGDGQQASVKLVERNDMQDDVENPVDITGGEVDSDGSDATLVDTDIPPRPEPGTQDDPDAFEGEKDLDGRLYEDGEF